MHFNIDYNEHSYCITATPQQNGHRHAPARFKITLDGYPMGCLTHSATGWTSDNIIDDNFIDMIGSCIKEQLVTSE